MLTYNVLTKNFIGYFINRFKKSLDFCLSKKCIIPFQVLICSYF